MEMGMKDIHNDLVKMRRDIEIVKNILMSEGELSDYAKKELAEARAEDEGEYTSLDDLEKEIKDEL